MFKQLSGGSLAAALLLISAAPVRSQEPAVYKKIAPEDLEKILKGLGIEFQKRSVGADVLLYSFVKNSRRVLLHCYDGKDLMLMSAFDTIPLVAINEWNRDAKFSRAVLDRDNKGESSTVEANLDLAGGVTDETIKHFIRRYDDDLKKYQVYVSRLLTREEVAFKAADAGRLERILKDMKIEFTKKETKTPGHIVFELKKNDQKVRLHSFEGKDLMMAAAFKPATLAAINKYNGDRKFVRAVLYRPANGDTYTTLESSLDCQGGVTDGIIRYFIGVFADEMRVFEEYLKK
jgi:hypothetical protein